MNRKYFFSQLIIFTGILFCLIATTTQATQTPVVSIKTATVVRTQIGDTLVSYGILEPDPDQIISLSLPHAGLINRVWVRLGQRVKAGDKLLEVITAPDARMQFLQAKSAVGFAKRELVRQQQLLVEQLTTKTQLDMVRKKLKDARTTLDALHKRGLNKIEETLYAPTNGIITQLNISQGQRVPTNTTVALIATQEHLIARLGIEPEDLSDVQPGTPVTIISVFVPDIKVTSQIREVHAMINPRTHLVEVLAPIPGQQAGKLVLGSRIIGTIHLPSHMALVVPRSAVLGTKNKAYLFTVSKGRAQRILVHTGIRTEKLIEVSGDIQAGDRVVTSGNYELRNGMAVRIEQK